MDIEVEPARDSIVSYVLEKCHNDPRPYLKVRVFGTEVKALLDSGASQSVLGKEGMWILQRFPAKLNSCPGRYVETVDASRHCVTGIVTLPITLKGRTEHLVVLVVPTLQQNLILGVDFWTCMHIVADVSNRRWEFSSQLNRSFCFMMEGIHAKEHLSFEEKEELQKLVGQHFSRNTSGLGRTDRIKHIIDTGDAPPIKQRYFPMSPAKQKLINEELDKMLELGVVEPSNSAWSSPIFLIDKPDGTKRFTVDFRKVNQVSRKDAYPLPQVTSILDRLRDARYLSSMDIKSAYWQIPLDPASKEKTAFTIPGRGLFQFTTMPFGLANAPATWQRFVDSILGPKLEPFVFVYLDDIIIVTSTFQKHIEILNEVFKRIKEAKLTLNREKCQFCRSELRYLGYVVSERGLQVDPDKVKSILDMPIPRNQKEVRQFHGTASWYRRFIPDFSTRMYPLTCLLKKRQKFTWSPEASAAFNDIRSCLVTSPILSCPDFSRPFTISCDASSVGLGAVLSQISDSGEVVIAYASRTLSKQEQKFSATERECLAVIWAVERFRPYVEGTKFTVVTDHYSLLWLNNLKDPQGRLARWTMRLQPYDFDLVHRKGKENVVPDLLSRTVFEAPQDKVDEVQLCYACNVEDVKDRWYIEMLKKVANQPNNYQAWQAKGDELWKRINDRKKRCGEANAWRLVLPKDKRQQALLECHDHPTSGHQGVFKTYKRIQMNYYWPKMKKDVATYVNRCKVCQKVKYDQQGPVGLMGERRGVGAPWQMIAADLIGPFPRSLKGNKYLLVVTDTFTKLTLLKPLRAATAKLVSSYLEDDIFMTYGVPKYIICDNGSEFIGSPMKRLQDEYRVKLLFNASRHPQANPAERVNKNVVTMLRAYIGENQRQWDELVPKISFALRTAVHESTGYSPAFLNFGRELSACGDGTGLSEMDQELPTMEDFRDYSQKMKDLQKIYQDVMKKLQETHSRNARHYNLRRRPLHFQEGQLVWKKNFVQSDASRFVSAKLTPRFVGPYKVAKKISSVIYTLEDQNGKSLGNWHVSDLKRYCE